MAKMYYNEQEAADKLNISNADLLNMVRDGQLRAYADGANRMFKVADVDALAPAAAIDSGESDIQLSPVEMSGTHAPISLADTQDTRTDLAAESGSDTVITSEGISIFDDDELDDLDLDTADPMSKTQIAPSLEEGIGIEAPSSGGSGLLDLTRESDDTSLGSDVLDHIDMESGEMDAMESGDGEVEPSVLTEQSEAAAPAMMEVPVYKEASGLYTGFAFGAFVIAMIVAVIAIGIMSGVVSPLNSILASKMLIYVGSAFGFVLICAIVGKIAGGKSA